MGRAPAHALTLPRTAKPSGTVQHAQCSVCLHEDGGPAVRFALLAQAMSAVDTVVRVRRRRYLRKQTRIGTPHCVLVYKLDLRFVWLLVTVLQSATRLVICASFVHASVSNAAAPLNVARSLL